MTQLSQPSFDSAPAWVKESLPAWLTPHIGRPGLGKPWSDNPAPLGRKVAGLDFWHANHFIVYKPQTQTYLDFQYTPLQFNYKPGLFPKIEKAVSHLQDRPRDIALGVELLTQVLPSLAKHPTVAPCGPHQPGNRAMDDEALIESGVAWCNEQSRLFVRLCQALGIPARMVFLFFSNGINGHVSSEFYAQGQWIQADPSWFCIYLGSDGLPLSTAQCHTPAGRIIVADTLRRRIDALLQKDDAFLGVHHHPKARQGLMDWRNDIDTCFDRFGIVNYPLPD